MFTIDNILLDENIVSKKFLCDANACKGSCCTFPGGSGAPVLPEEVELIEDSLEVAAEYLAEYSLKEIEERGTVQFVDGEYETTCIDEKDCVFVYYEDSIAKCAIEKAFHEGKTTFRKPISCWLYPIRLADFGGDYLYFDDFEGCKPALAHGQKHNVTVFEMLEEPLTQVYGKEWYAKLKEFAKKQKERKTTYKKHNKNTI
jgi:hypothetical protein